RRAVGEAGGVHGAQQEIAGAVEAVAGEDAARAVRAVRRRREADDEDAGLRVAEAGNRTRPVGVVPIRGAARLGDRRAPRPQARTALARDDLAMDARKGTRNRKLAWIGA